MNFYTNFLGQILYVGREELMQEVTDYLKGGFGNCINFMGDFFDENITVVGFRPHNELRIYDTLKDPQYVHHLKTEPTIDISE